MKKKNGCFQPIMFILFAGAVSSVFMAIVEGGVNNISTIAFIIALITGSILYIENTTNKKVEKDFPKNQKVTISYKDLNIFDKKDIFKDTFFELDQTKRHFILNTWLQNAHNNDFIDDGISFYLHQLDHNLSESMFLNLLSLTYGSQDEKGIYMIERRIVSFILEDCDEECEIDRLCFIYYTVRGNKPPQEHKEILDIGYRNWVKNYGELNIPYRFLLNKSYIDVLIFKKHYSLATAETEKSLDELINFSNSEFYWLKYQLSHSLLSLYQKGYVSKKFPFKFLKELNKKFLDDAQVG